MKKNTEIIEAEYGVSQYPETASYPVGERRSMGEIVEKEKQVRRVVASRKEVVVSEDGSVKPKTYVTIEDNLRKPLIIFTIAWIALILIAATQGPCCFIDATLIPPAAWIAYAMTHQYKEYEVK